MPMFKCFPRTVTDYETVEVEAKDAEEAVEIVEEMCDKGELEYAMWNGAKGREELEVEVQQINVKVT